MQALVLRGVRDLALEGVARPVPAADEVLIQVSLCGICGSDLHGYLGRSARRSAHMPLSMGHEFAGQLVEAGSDVRGRWAIGQRVTVQPVISCGHCPACRAGLSNICPNMSIVGIERAGAFAEFVAVPAHQVWALPDHTDDVEGAMVEALATEVHLFRRMAAVLPRSVVVLGCGAQGLLAIQLARLAGANLVVASDLVTERLALAERLGAIAVRADREDPVRRVLELSGGWGAQLVIDAVGAPVTRQQGMAMLGPGGTLGLVGLGMGETEFDFLPVVNRELNIRGSYCYDDDNFDRALELIVSSQIRVQDMIHVLPLAEGVSCFEQLAAEPSGLVKVLLRAG